MVAVIRLRCCASSFEGKRGEVCMDRLMKSLKPGVRILGAQDKFIEWCQAERGL